MHNVSPSSSRIAGIIDRLAGISGGLAIAIFTAIIVYVVVCRYAFSFTPRWSEEIPRLLLVWVTFIGAISAFIRNTHLCAGLTDLMVSPGNSRRYIALLARAMSLLFLIVVFWSSWKITTLTWGHQTTVLSWPAGLVYLALPVTAFLALAALVAQGLRK